ncbi:uncharacterized protein BCR38DRAFT_192739 [Pseudomassariella vexata]|uniref:Uncharacterized protein n=1 Tax=Pseudomassariella vexata TaxID=1141098 RepID=A0A1Y2E0W7_9PEZI|nr:uncharacterized protein BCR38DRAFT_192739 [Pseudomassariella vexata]ORY65180.1 hypothetical protein BCR38DRAFT_192739 [Pseudomassariella vexata]
MYLFPAFGAFACMKVGTTHGSLNQTLVRRRTTISGQGQHRAPLQTLFLMLLGDAEAFSRLRISTQCPISNYPGSARALTEPILWVQVVQCSSLQGAVHVPPRGPINEAYSMPTAFSGAYAFAMPFDCMTLALSPDPSQVQFTRQPLIRPPTSKETPEYFELYNVCKHVRTEESWLLNLDLVLGAGLCISGHDDA